MMNITFFIKIDGDHMIFKSALTLFLLIINASIYSSAASFAASIKPLNNTTCASSKPAQAAATSSAGHKTNSKPLIVVKRSALATASVKSSSSNKDEKEKVSNASTSSAYSAASSSSSNSNATASQNHSSKKYIGISKEDLLKKGIEENRQKFTFKHDRYTARRGKPKMIEIHCRHCNHYLMTYQKDGEGNLLRCYLDRIHAPEELQKLQNRRFDVNDFPSLRCLNRKCQSKIGIPMDYQFKDFKTQKITERRSAYKLIQGRFYISKG